MNKNLINLEKARDGLADFIPGEAQRHQSVVCSINPPKSLLLLVLLLLLFLLLILPQNKNNNKKKN